MPKSSNEFYLSVDIEADGPIPGLYSMLSFGAVAYSQAGEELGRFSANLRLLATAQQSGYPETMMFWRRNPAAYDATRVNQEYPAEAMDRFRYWLATIRPDAETPGTPVIVGWPGAYDLMWLSHYWYFTQEVKAPFHFADISLKTVMWLLRGGSWRYSVKNRMPGRWREGEQHTHVAVEDAAEQGALFFRMLAEARRRLETT